MRPSQALIGNHELIREIVAAHRATNPRIFGSTLYARDTDTSDLDLLIDPSERMSLLDLGALKERLSDELGVTVDVLTPKALPDDARDRIISEAVPV